MLLGERVYAHEVVDGAADGFIIYDFPRGTVPQS
jgi:hypothetical protein